MAVETEYTFQDAIVLTKFRKFNYFLIVLTGLILASGYLESSCINVIFPIIECELNLSNFDKGLLGSIGYAGIVLSSHFWGFMADTRGRKKVIVFTLITSFLFTVISTFATSFWFLLLFRFLNGFCICAPQTITYAFVGEFHSAKNRDRVVLMASVSYVIFAMISPLNGYLYINKLKWSLYIPFLDINYGSWRMYLLMCGVPSIISAMLMLFIPESPQYTYAQGDEAATLKILQKMHERNKDEKSNEYEVKKLVKDEEFCRGSEQVSKGFFNFMWSQTVLLFKHPHLKNTLTACYLQFGFYVCNNGFSTFLPETLNKVFIYLDNHRDQPATICGILESFEKNDNSSTDGRAMDFCVTSLKTDTFVNLTMLSGLFGLFFLIMSVVVNKTGKLVIMNTFLFGAGISSILLIFLPFPMLSVYLYFIVILVAINIAVVNASTIELFPTNYRAMAVSVSMMVGRIGSTFGSNFMGLLLKDYCSYTWLLPAILCISGGFLAFTIPNISKRMS